MEFQYISDNSKDPTILEQYLEFQIREKITLEIENQALERIKNSPLHLALNIPNSSIFSQETSSTEEIPSTLEFQVVDLIPK